MFVLVMHSLRQVPWRSEIQEVRTIFWVSLLREGFGLKEHLYFIGTHYGNVSYKMKSFASHDEVCVDIILRLLDIEWKFLTSFNQLA